MAAMNASRRPSGGEERVWRAPAVTAPTLLTRPFLIYHLVFDPFLCAVSMAATYPTKEEAALVAAAEKLMMDTMARYDPSHDAYHGRSFAPPSPRRKPARHGGHTNIYSAGTGV